MKRLLRVGLAFSLLVVGVMRGDAAPTKITLPFVQFHCISGAGTAEITFDHATSIDISVGGLAPRAFYQVVLNLSPMAGLNTDDNGAADVSLSTSPHGRVLPLPLNADLINVGSMAVQDAGGPCLMYEAPR